MQNTSTKRFLSMALSVGMTLSLLPAGVLAAEESTPPRDPVTEVSQTAETTPPEQQLQAAEPADVQPGSAPELNFADGAVHDTWEQDPQTVQGSPICTKEDGRLHLKAGQGNGNNHSYSNGPAVFVDKTASQALGAVEPGQPSFLEFTVEALNEAKDFRFGVMLNYENPGKALFVGTDAGGWFWETHGRTGGDAWQSARKVGAPQKNVPVRVRLEWTDTTLTRATVDGKDIFDGPLPFTGIDGGTSGRGTVGFRLAGWGNDLTECIISQVKYSGQAVVPGYAISGTVTAAGGGPLAGASVTLGTVSVTADDQGRYAFDGADRLPNGSYTLTASAAGYRSAGLTVEVQDGAVENADFTLRERMGGKGTVRGSEDAPVEGAEVIITGGSAPVTVYTDETGVFRLPDLPAGSYTVAAAADFFRAAAPVELEVTEDGTDGDLTLVLEPIGTAVLSTDRMDVTVADDFPLAMTYEMKGQLAGKQFLGQTRYADTVIINGVSVRPVSAAGTRVSDTRMDYDLEFRNTGSKTFHVVVHVTLEAAGNTLEFRITDVDYPDDDRLTNPMETIKFYDQSLISVRSDQPGADLAIATLAPNTVTSGDTFAAVDGALEVSHFHNKDTRYAFLSNDQLSAGVFSNSDVGSGGAGDNNDRLSLTAYDRGGRKTVGAGSNLWFYDRKISSADARNAADVDHLLTAEEKVVGIRPDRDEMPSVKVIITGDRNGDGLISWQDAAVDAREQEVVHIPAHSDTVPDAVTTRIAMNFESEAANPFLTTLDNVKRVANHSDGLGQSVLLKGYASEGHDSGHPDYYDIGERMGGPEDFNTMLHEGHKLGAQFGIHTNASEFYPESDAFSDEAVRWDGSGIGGSVHYGWNWLDQGIAMNGVYDLAKDYRYDRYRRLHDLVGDNSNGGDGLDYIYVDVWGNWTNGSEDAWHTRKLNNDITAGGNNWRIAHEWSFANDWDSTFQHWVSDFTYGEWDHKGKLNSEIMRFMLNGHKDSFVPDFPTFGGAANAPLLGGPVMQGFEGWQSDIEYDQFIHTLYNQMLPTKFLQHYDIMQWVDNGEPVKLPATNSAGNNTWNGPTGKNIPSHLQGKNAFDWTPEVQIRLAGAGDDVVVTRGYDDQIDDSYSYGTYSGGTWGQSEADQTARRTYRARTITLNGRVVLVGAPDPGDFRTGNSVSGDMKYLLPWYWDSEGVRVSAGEEKLYHFNLLGGESTWELPDGWENLTSVVVYKLTDLGRTEKQTVAVTGGSVTLKAEANTPYLVVRGENGPTAPDVTWTAPNQHLSDVSFNSVLEQHWTAEGGAEIVKTGHDIPLLRIAGAGSVKQELKELKAGTQYAVYVGVDNRSDGRASLSILDSRGRTVASNYTLRSFSPNVIGSYVHQRKHGMEDGVSYFQNMYVFFTPEAGETYTLVLSHEDVKGNAYFDDVRVVENSSEHNIYDRDGSVIGFQQDFEDVAQGLYPFVVVNGGQATDCRLHLAKKHSPYTQKGWQDKKGDDVLSGGWSVKINGQSGRNSLMMATVPQNIHFEPGVSYDVSFDYQMGSAGTYDVVIGDGTRILQHIALEESLGSTRTAKFTVVGAESGQTWFGIWSTARAADTQGTKDGTADFGGYKDFVLDNLTVQTAKVQTGVLSALLEQARTMKQTDYAGDWAAFVRARDFAEEIMGQSAPSAHEVRKAAADLKAAMDALTRYENHLEVTAAPGARVTLEDSAYQPILTLTADESGKALFSDLSTGSYKVKVEAEGFEVVTADVMVLQDTTTPLAVELTARTAHTYLNDFNTGSIASIQALPGNAGGGSKEVLEAVDGQLKVTFRDYDRNTVVDTAIQMKNGTVELDLTPLNVVTRFGVSLRSLDMNHRIFAGPFDSSSKVGWEYWGEGGSSYGSDSAGPAFIPNVTRTVKVTIQDKTISFWVDGVPVLKNVTMSNPPAEAGYVGLNSGRNPGAAFLVDNLRVTLAEDEILAFAREKLELVAGLETVTLAHTADIRAARSAYEALTEEQQAAIDEALLTALTAAEKTLAGLEQEAADRKAAAEVDALIDAIGTVTTQSGPSITAARKAFDGLTKTQRAYVTGEQKLKDAEKALADLQRKPGGGGSSGSGSQKVTTRDPDGTVIVTETRKDGTVVTEMKRPDGSTGITTVEKDGSTRAEVKLSGQTGGSSAALPVPPLDPAAAPVVKVEQKPAETTELFIPVKHVTSGTVAMLVRPDGTEEVIRRTAQTEGGLLVPVTGTVTLKVKDNSRSFADMTGHWAADAVNFVAARGIFNGVSDTAFAPDVPTTRAMLVQVLYNLEGAPQSGFTGRFDDVADDAWYAESIRWAAGRGIVAGVGDNRFDPEAPLTREQLTVMLYRFAGSPRVEKGSLEFRDSGSVSDWAKDAMLWAVSNGLIGGLDDGTLAPAGTATRAQLAAIISRFINLR